MNSLYCFCQLSGAHICVPAGGDDIAGAAKASAAFNPCGYALDADVVACLRYISSTVAACTAADGEETDAASAPVTSAAQRSLVMSEMPRPRTLSAMVFCRIWIWPALLGRPYNRTATAFTGATGVRPDSVAPLAEMLRLNGYATAAFGKSHGTPPWELSNSGPDMTDQSIQWVQSEKSLTPDKPFFIYFAPGATHAPYHAPKEWIAKYKGKFDQGWDKLRSETLARQKALGVVPAATQLAPKPDAIKDWDGLSADEMRLFARQMEVFAAFGEYADAEIGRLIATLKDLGQLDNTLIFYVIGDNGASAEGGTNGLFNEMTYFNNVEEPITQQLAHIDDLGGPLGYNHYAAGWAVAGDTPFTWTKQVAGSYGGTRNGMVVYWPKGANER